MGHLDNILMYLGPDLKPSFPYQGNGWLKDGSYSSHLSKLSRNWDHLSTLVPFATKPQIGDHIGAPVFQPYVCIDANKGSVHFYTYIQVSLAGYKKFLAVEVILTFFSNMQFLQQIR